MNIISHAMCRVSNIKGHTNGFRGRNNKNSDRFRHSVGRPGLFHKRIARVILPRLRRGETYR